MSLKFDDADALAMKTVERLIIQTILPFRERIEAALVIFALARCARTLLRLYPESTQKWILQLVVAFLEGKTEMPKGLAAHVEARRLITLN